MSKTDKTKPHKFADPHWCPYPCKHVSISKGLAWYTYKHERHFRAQLRADQQLEADVGRGHVHEEWTLPAWGHAHVSWSPRGSGHG